MAVAKTICDTILDELNAFSRSDSRPDPFTVSRLSREINKLEKADYMAARLCMGILHTIQGNAKEAIAAFEELLEYAPEDANIHQNYGHTLGKLRMINSAIEHYRLAVEYSSEATEALSDLSECAQTAFRPREFLDILNSNLHKADIETLKSNVYIQRTVQMAKLFEKIDLSDEDANQIYSIAEEILIRYDIAVESGSFHETSAFGFSKLTFYAELLESDDRIYELNEDLCDLLVEREMTHLLKSLTYIFVPVSTDAASQ